MSEPPPPDRPEPLPVGGVAGDVAGRLGEDVGRFARLAMRRLEQMASDGAAMAGQMMAGQPRAAHTGADQREADASGSTPPNAPPPGSATARAEAMVDGAGAQLGTFATLMSHQLRRAAALAREEAEDIWAEAQQIRGAQRGDPDEGQGGIS